MRLIYAEAFLQPYNKCVNGFISALTDEDVIKDFTRYCLIADAIEETPAIMSWHDAKTDLPNPGQRYIVYAPGQRPISAGYTEFGWILPGLYPEPTHWMEMPPLPEEDC